MDVKLCKIQKVTNFTHFAPKIFHFNLSKTVYIYTCATVTMHIDVYPIILLISHSAHCLMWMILRSGYVK